MSTAWGNIETAIAAALTKDASEGETASPFGKRVYDGSDMSDVDLAERLQALTGEAPAAIVYCLETTADGGHAGEIKEQAMFGVLVVAAGTTQAAALRGDTHNAGVWDLVEFCRGKLHGNRELTGINNPLEYVGNKRFSLREFRLTVAARVVLFKAPIRF